jgi:hypothetical protein
MHLSTSLLELSHSNLTAILDDLGLLEAAVAVRLPALAEASDNTTSALETLGGRRERVRGWVRVAWVADWLVDTWGGRRDELKARMREVVKLRDAVRAPVEGVPSLAAQLDLLRTEVGRLCAGVVVVHPDAAGVTQVKEQYWTAPLEVRDLYASGTLFCEQMFRVLDERWAMGERPRRPGPSHRGDYTPVEGLRREIKLDMVG